MVMSMRNKQLSGMCLAIAFLLMPGLSIAAEGRSQKSGKALTDQQTVEMFSAIEKGQINVKLIPKDSTRCRVLIENKTDKPLSVKLPETFAGVPVLAQAAGPRPGAGGGGGGNNSNNNNNSNQSMGGGMGGMGGMGGGGFFNVAPEQVGKLNVTTVCLEHGKGEPNARIPYEIKPLDSVTKKSGVAELCGSLGYNQVDQRAAQAAAWHLNNDMSWQELAAKRLKHANGTSEPYFSQQEIQTGMKVAALAMKVAEEKKSQQHFSDSLNQPSPSANQPATENKK